MAIILLIFLELLFSAIDYMIYAEFYKGMIFGGMIWLVFIILGFMSHSLYRLSSVAHRLFLEFQSINSGVLVNLSILNKLALDSFGSAGIPDNTLRKMIAINIPNATDVYLYSYDSNSTKHKKSLDELLRKHTNCFNFSYIGIHEVSENLFSIILVKTNE